MKPLEAAARHLKAGQLEDAAGLCLEVLEQTPENVTALRLLGNVRVAQKLHTRAIRCYKRVLAIAPNAVETHNNLGAVQQILGNSKLAAECFRRAMALQPGYAQAHCNLGVALRKLGHLDDAIASQRRAIELMPDYAKAHYNLGNALKTACEVDAAIHAYQQAILHDPGHSEAHNNLGTVFEGRGHPEKALAKFSQAVAIDENYVDAHYNFTLMHRFEEDDPTLDKLRQLIRKKGRSPQNKNRLTFAMAKAKADMDDDDGAFKLFTKGNAQRRKRLSYDGAAAEQEVEDIVATNLAPQPTEPADETKGAPTPIFILGLSRSGKSLVESLLASQAGVFAAGESEHWQRLGLSLKKTIPDDDRLARHGAVYRKEIRRLAGDARFFVSTLDSNILHLGEIATALPEARFIHCTREPLDNALLIYFKRYEHGHAYAYDFSDIAHFMAQRAKAQTHWRRLYGDCILMVEYEALVEDSAASAAQLTAYSGFDFEATAALPKLNRDEIGYWQRFDKHLQPLHAALAESLNGSENHASGD